MFEQMNENEARQEILKLVAEYAKKYKCVNKPYSKGDRIPYAARVYDEKERVNLVDSALEFWLTSGRYTDEFEKRFADYLGVRYVSVVYSGCSSRNRRTISSFSSGLYVHVE